METGTKPRTSHKKILVLAILAFVVVNVIGITGYLISQHGGSLLGNAQQQGTADLVAKVGQLVQLPSGEQPTIATVSDVTQLQGQPLFKQAENGDKVLIYAQAKKAILYRPSTGKVIDIGPVAVSQPGEQAGRPSPSTAQIVASTPSPARAASGSATK